MGRRKTMLLVVAFVLTLVVGGLIGHALGRQAEVSPAGALVGASLFPGSHKSPIFTGHGDATHTWNVRFKQKDNAAAIFIHTSLNNYTDIRTMSVHYTDGTEETYQPNKRITYCNTHKCALDPFCPQCITGGQNVPFTDKNKGKEVDRITFHVFHGRGKGEATKSDFEVYSQTW